MSGDQWHVEHVDVIAPDPDGRLDLLFAVLGVAELPVALYRASAVRKRAMGREIGGTLRAPALLKISRRTNQQDTHR